MIHYPLQGTLKRLDYLLNYLNSSPNSEMKWTPLQLACLTRDNTFLEDFCTFEIQSPNRKHCLIIRVAVQSAEKWFNALMASVEATINDAMEKANSALTGNVKFIFNLFS